MKYKVINEAVLYNNEAICTLSGEDMTELARLGLSTKEQRTRLCTHADPEALVHEMFIIHTKDTYVRPHRHLTKNESFQVLQGEATLILFDDDGNIQQTIQLGDFASRKTFYFKMPAMYWHMLIIQSDVLVFKEVTQGPFDSEDCVFPDWAPEGRHCSEVPEYMAKVQTLAGLGHD